VSRYAAIKVKPGPVFFQFMHVRASEKILYNKMVLAFYPDILLLYKVETEQKLEFRFEAKRTFSTQEPVVDEAHPKPICEGI
jgi:hypothetical protein